MENLLVANNSHLVTVLEAKLLGDKMLNSPHYQAVNARYQEALRIAPLTDWKVCPELKQRLEEVLAMVRLAEAEMVTITMTKAQHKELIEALDGLECDMSSQANSLEGGDVSWDCYDRDNWINDHALVMKAVGILKLDIKSSLSEDEETDEE